MTKEEVLTVIEEYAGRELSEDTKIDQVAVDSLEFVDMILHLSDVIGKDLPDELLGRLDTVEDLMAAYSS